VMDDTWRDLLMHCHGYDPVAGADGFVRLVKACQVETTMPLNDYYAPMPALRSASLIGAVAPLLVTLVLLIAGLLGGLFTAWFGGHGRWWWLAALIGLIALPLTAIFAVRRITAAGQAPLPTGHRTDLISVTKALHLQQAFTRFAIAQQGAAPEALHGAFGDFLRQHRPDDPLAPTQARGTVSS